MSSKSKNATKSLPSASDVAKAAANSTIATQKQQNEERKQDAIKSLASFIVNAAVQYLTERADAIAQGAGDDKAFHCIFSARPPLIDKCGEEKVYKYPAAETHWVGMESDGSAMPAEKDGFPMSILLQGTYNKETHQNEPQLLPGGKTAVQVAEKLLSSKAEGYSLRCFFTAGRINVYLIWNLPVYVDWETKKKQQRASGGRPQRREEPRQEPRQEQRRRRRNQKESNWADDE